MEYGGHRLLKDVLGPFFIIFFFHVLTIRKHAPIMTAFMRTSKSIGNVMPKKSASENASRNRPLHCLDIRPTSIGGSSNVTIYCGINKLIVTLILLLNKLYYVRLDGKGKPYCLTS